jgi:hypothetical protein
MKLRSMEELTDGVIGLVYVYDQHGRRYAPCFKNNTKLHTAADETLDPEKCLGWVPYLPQNISDKTPTSSEARQARQRVGKWMVGISVALVVIAGLFDTLSRGQDWLPMLAFAWVQLIGVSGVMTGCMFWWREGE